MPTFSVKASAYSDINRVANRMRQVDVTECRAAGHTPKAALVAAFRSSSLCWTVMADGKPCALFGVAAISAIEGRGAIWMLGTDDLSKAGRAWLTLVPPYLAAMHREYPRLENMISTENRASARWLKRLGFDFNAEVVHIGGVPMQRFHKGF